MSFPAATKISVVRHPFDVFLSAKEYWKTPDDQIWHTITTMYRILLHKNAKLQRCFSFEELYEEPEYVVRETLSLAGLTFEPGMRTAFNKLHAPRTDKPVGDVSEYEARKNLRFSHANKWSGQIDQTEKRPAAALSAYMDLVDAFSLNIAN